MRATRIIERITEETRRLVTKTQRNNTVFLYIPRHLESTMTQTSSGVLKTTADQLRKRGE